MTSSRSARRNCTEVMGHQMMHIRKYMNYDPMYRKDMDSYMSCILPLPDADIDTGCFLHFADSKRQKMCIHHLGHRPIFEIQRGLFQ